MCSKNLSSYWTHINFIFIFFHLIVAHWWLGLVVGLRLDLHTSSYISTWIGSYKFIQNHHLVKPLYFLMRNTLRVTHTERLTQTLKRDTHTERFTQTLKRDTQHWGRHRVSQTHTHRGRDIMGDTLRERNTHRDTHTKRDLNTDWETQTHWESHTLRDSHKH